MAGWSEFTLAMVTFFLSHALPVRPGVKARLTALIGARGFTLAYSALSLAVLTWLIVAAGRAPFVVLWTWAPWQNHVTLTLMFLALAVLSLGLARPNPLSFGGARNENFDPAHPGLIGWTRHPVLIALALWAFGHLIANGDLAHVILFATFGGFALIGGRIIDRRKRRQMGEGWTRLAATRREVRVTSGGITRLILAALTYGTILALHGPVIGVSPIP